MRVNEAGTVRESGATATGNAGIPAAIGDRYRIEEAMRASGAEADLFKVAGADGRTRVAKVYRYGIEPNTEATAAIAALDTRRVVRIEEHGRDEGRAWEILEYVPGGNLRENPPRGEHETRDLLEQLTDALESIHRSGIEHRDLKPENVLVRRNEPKIDIAVSDFGIASVVESTVHFTQGAHTPRYAPPEAIGAQSTVVRTRWDWWSVGMVIVERLTGQHPLGDEPDALVGYRLMTGNTDELVDKVKDPRWRKLCKGLLRRRPEHRWGAEEVRKWLAGRDHGLEVREENGSDAGREIRFAGRGYTSAVGLGNAMAEADPEEAASFWERRRGSVADWLEDCLGERSLAQAVKSIGATTNTAKGLKRAIAALSAEGVELAGMRVSREALRPIVEAAEAGDEQAAAQLHRIYSDGRLEQHAETCPGTQAAKLWEEYVGERDRHLQTWARAGARRVDKETTAGIVHKASFEETSESFGTRWAALLADVREIRHRHGEAAGEGTGRLEAEHCLRWIANVPGSRAKVLSATRQRLKGRNWRRRFEMERQRGGDDGATNPAIAIHIATSGRGCSTMGTNEIEPSGDGSPTGDGVVDELIGQAGRFGHDELVLERIAKLAMGIDPVGCRYQDMEIPAMDRRGAIGACYVGRWRTAMDGLARAVARVVVEFAEKASSRIYVDPGEAGAVVRRGALALAEHARTAMASPEACAHVFAAMGGAGDCDEVRKLKSRIEQIGKGRWPLIAAMADRIADQARREDNEWRATWCIDEPGRNARAAKRRSNDLARIVNQATGASEPGIARAARVFERNMEGFARGQEKSLGNWRIVAGDMVKAATPEHVSGQVLERIAGELADLAIGRRSIAAAAARSLVEEAGGGEEESIAMRRSEPMAILEKMTMHTLRDRPRYRGTVRSEVTMDAAEIVASARPGPQDPAEIAITAKAGRGGRLKLRIGDTVEAYVLGSGKVWIQAWSRDGGQKSWDAIGEVQR